MKTLECADLSALWFAATCRRIRVNDELNARRLRQVAEDLKR